MSSAGASASRRTRSGSLITADDLAYRDEIVLWGRRAVARIEGFYNSAYGNRDMVLDDDQLPEVHFTFLKPDVGESVGHVTNVIGE